MGFSQYGIYLVPPPHLLIPINNGHRLLDHNFNIRAAGQFMVHCTVKGFFKLKGGTSPGDFIPALDGLFAVTPPFPTEILKAVTLNRGPGRVSILLLLERTPAFHNLHNQVWEIVRPFIAPDCLFSSVEPAGPNFPPHITLAQYDAPYEPGLLIQVEEYCNFLLESSLRGKFQGRSMQLIEFYSDDWTGEWWKSLSYKQLKGWNLMESGLSLCRS